MFLYHTFIYMTMRSFLLIAIFLHSSTCLAKTFQVGPSRTYTAPSKMMSLVSDGDTVEIDAGSYSGDVGTWVKNDLVIRSVGGMAHLDAAGKSAGGKAIWVITGNHTYIENIEFSGCTVVDKNGAGIRQEGAGLELRHCYFHDNEDGVLAGKNLESDILFEACEFARNGYGDGFSHNMYIGNIRTFTMRFCYSHHAKIGHCVKSRAMNNYILYNRIMDEDTGSASYLINLPNGGMSIVLGNTMMKGPHAQNRTLVDYGSEGLSNPDKRLYVVNNTMVSSRSGGATFVSVASGTDSARIFNNIFAGSGNIYSGIADTSTNYYSAEPSSIPFKNLVNFDYHIDAHQVELVGILGRVTHPYFVGGIPLSPQSEYLDPTDSIPWSGSLSILYRGAFGIHLENIVNKNLQVPIFQNFPNPFSVYTTLTLSNIEEGTLLTMNIFHQLGNKILTKNLIPQNSQIIFERGNLPSGVYYYEIGNSKGERIGTGKFIIL